MTARSCNGCTLCCRLVPVAEISKLANQRCQHQRHMKGCAIHAFAPASCKKWSCAWLSDEDAGGLSRPDRAHYVIDITPDFVRMQWPDGREDSMPVLQVWCDPAYPDAHRDPALRAYLSAGPVGALVRYNSNDAIIIIPPEITGEDHWFENSTAMQEHQHTSAEIMAAVGTMNITKAPA
jgi:hypothetical protein